jgi:hypothetical protein
MEINRNLEIINTFFQKLKEDKTMNKTQIEAMIENFWSMFSTIGLIYLTAFGLILTNYLNTAEWNWSILIYATVLDAIPITKSWLQSQANKKIIQQENEFAIERMKWVDEKDKLKDELQGLKISNGIYKETQKPEH